MEKLVFCSLIALILSTIGVFGAPTATGEEPNTETKEHVSKVHAAAVKLAHHLGELFRKDDGKEALVSMSNSKLFSRISDGIKKAAENIDAKALAGKDGKEKEQTHHKLHSLWAFTIAKHLLNGFTSHVHKKAEDAHKHFGHLFQDIESKLGLHIGVEHLLHEDAKLTKIFKDEIDKLPIKVHWPSKDNAQPFEPVLELESEAIETN